MKHPFPPAPRCVCALLLLAIYAGVVVPAPRATSASQLQAPQVVFLPLVANPDAFAQNAPIWPARPTPASHEVALFRHAFALDAMLSGAELQIFADTRYEVWVDGRWIGRGPARFSRATREYDTYALGDLAPGQHVIAALVQWAPNERRSESVAPLLQAHIQGAAAGSRVVVARTGPHWKAIRSDAWRADAAPVHAWNLIGPTELLDLRRLPAGWMLPGFDDQAWPGAVVGLLPGSRYSPRSIPALANEPVAVALRDRGLLSPGRALGELPPGRSYSVEFAAPATGLVATETLSATGHPLPATALLDGRPLTWVAVPGRPDVYRVQASVSSGRHTLSFSGLPPQGWTFGAPSLAGAPPPPFEQGAHAGRRLLLAEPVSQPQAVAVSTGPRLDLAFGEAPAYAVLDLGRVVHGRVVADVSGPAGAVVDVGWDERLWQGRRPLPFPGALHPQWNQVDSWVLDGASRALTTIDSRAGRYLLVAVWGGPVRLGNVQVLEERYPAQPAGAFRASDERLARIWQVGVDTLRPNMTDAYADPWRERGQWWGDAFVADRANQVAFGDTRLLRRGLALMAESFSGGQPRALAPHGEGNYMLDYGMLWVQSLADYARITGDRAFLEASFPTLRAFLAYLERYHHPATGLIELPVDNWSRTVYLDPVAAANRYGQSTAVNAMYYGTLGNAAALAEQLGDADQAEVWRQQAARVRSQVNARLYQPAEGRYSMSIRDGIVLAPSVHAQAWALAYGLPPDDQQQRVADAMLALMRSSSNGVGVEVYGMYWVLEALGRTGRIAEARGLLEQTYGRMLDAGATTWWENFGANERYTASLSHGWGAAPTWFLSTYVLGARRTGPATWTVRPDLRMTGVVAGTLPLAVGALRVEHEHLSCGSNTLRLDVPPGAGGEVIIPMDAGGMTISLDGQPIEAALPEQGSLRLPLAPGQHTIEVRRPCGTLFLPLATR